MCGRKILGTGDTTSSVVNSCHTWLSDHLYHGSRGLYATNIPVLVKKLQHPVHMILPCGWQAVQISQMNFHDSEIHDPEH